VRALLVGGNGFIGSHVKDVLLQRGHSVRVLDPLPERYRLPLPDVDYRGGSSADPSALAEALAGVDAVVYLASSTVPSTSNADAPWDVSSNLVPLIATLDAMVRASVRRIVYFSSGGTAYGVTGDQAVAEDEPLDPICSYGIVKVASEKYLGMYGHLHGIRPLILRPSNPLGPRQGHDGIQGFVGTTLLRLLRNEPIEIWGDGSIVRDYVYVADLALATVIGAETGGCGAVNIGSGEGRSLLQVLDTMTTVTGVAPQVRFLPGRAFDVPHLVLTVKRARDVLGWMPTTPFQEGVAAHWEWLQRCALQPRQECEARSAERRHA